MFLKLHITFEECALFVNVFIKDHSSGDLLMELNEVTFTHDDISKGKIYFC